MRNFDILGLHVWNIWRTSDLQVKLFFFCFQHVFNEQKLKNMDKKTAVFKYSGSEYWHLRIC